MPLWQSMQVLPSTCALACCVCARGRCLDASMPAQEWQKVREEVDGLFGRVIEDFLTQALAKIGLTPAAAGVK